MRNITENGLSLIKNYEKLAINTYICPAGYPTIGYGHVVKPAEATSFANGINEHQANALLAADVGVAECAVLRLISVPLTDGQFDALVSFTFNLGAGALQRSTLRRKVNRGDHDEVPAEFMKWGWAGGRKLKGLIRRRAAEVVLFQS